MQKVYWFTTTCFFLTVLDYSDQCCGFSCVRLVIRAMEPRPILPFCCCCSWWHSGRHGRWPPYDKRGRWPPGHHHGRWPSPDEHGEWPPQEQPGQWPPQDQKGQWNDQGQSNEQGQQNQYPQPGFLGQQSSQYNRPSQEGEPSSEKNKWNNQEGQWASYPPQQQGQPNLELPPSQEAPNDEEKWLPLQDSKANNVRRTVNMNLTGENMIAMCIYCAPPRPPPWPRPTRPPWTRPTRPIPPYTTRTTWFTRTSRFTRTTWFTRTTRYTPRTSWFTRTTRYTPSTTWFTKTTRHTTTTTPSTTTTPFPTTTTPATTTPPPTTRTTTTTTTESPTTPPWIPDVIPPNEDDEAPKFTATIATQSEEPVCSAAIISIHFLLSSCIRCLQKNGKAVARDDVVILVGDFSTDEVSGLGIASYNVKTVVLHPNCLRDGKYSLKHDVGLVQTYDEIEYSSTVAPAKVPEKQIYRPDDARNWILAAFRSRNTIARTPKEAVWFVKVRTVQPEICLLVLNSSYYDATHNYCTAYHHYGRTDNCWDDFGASLSLDNTLIGVLIHKFRCGRVGAAGSYASIAFNSPWIRNAVQKLSKGSESV